MARLHEIKYEKFLTRLYCDNHLACFDINLHQHQEVYKRIGSCVSSYSTKWSSLSAQKVCYRHVVESD